MSHAIVASSSDRAWKRASASAGNLRGTAGDDALLVFGASTYLGGAGDDIYVLSGAAQPAITAVINDANAAIADTIQFADGPTILSSQVFANAAQLILSNGAVIQLLNAAAYAYEIGANVTTGDGGAVRDFAGFVADTLGIQTAPDGSGTGGQVAIGAGAEPMGAEGEEIDLLL